MSEFGFGGGQSADPEFGGFGAGAQQPDNGVAPLTEADFTLDLSDAEPVPDYVPMPPGEYTFLVKESYPDRAKTGSAMARLVLVCWDPGPFEGRVIKDQLVVPNKAKQEPTKYKQSVDYFTNNLECITGQKWAGETRTLKPKEHLEGQMCRAYVVQKPNQNDPNMKHNEIGRYLPKTKGAAPASSGATPGFGGFGG